MDKTLYPQIVVLDKLLQLGTLKPYPVYAPAKIKSSQDGQETIQSMSFHMENLSPQLIMLILELSIGIYSR